MNQYLMTIITTAIVIVLILQYIKTSCQPQVHVYPGCPNIPSSQYTDTPSGRCLLDCDKYSDSCYQECNKEENCVRRCYQIKAQCYMHCLGQQVQSSSEDCGCTQNQCKYVCLK